MASTDARESTVTTAARSTEAGVGGPTRAEIDARTLRQDRWWLSPLATFAVFFSFVVYSTSAPSWGVTTSPSRTSRRSTRRASATASRGPRTSASRSGWLTLSPALIILIFPLGFRLTCYYYRKAYYRAFWLSPPACGVAEPHEAYTGETRFPLVLQNVHRYFFYPALVVALILT